MPCKNDFHAHEWTKSGVLSIAKCETICNFCISGKEYKPASALRKVRYYYEEAKKLRLTSIKHVLTHIKNERLPLTLEHSVSGRPKKWDLSLEAEGILYNGRSDVRGLISLLLNLTPLHRVAASQDLQLKLRVLQIPPLGLALRSWMLPNRGT